MPPRHPNFCHRTRHSVFLIAAAWLALLADLHAAPHSAFHAASNAPPHYRLTDLGTLPDADSSEAFGIDAQGRVVGCASRLYVYVFIPTHPLLWDHGHRRNLGLLKGYTGGRALAIGADGQIVGAMDDLKDPLKYRRRAFLFRDGVLTDLGLLPGYPDSQAVSINAHGLVAGYASEYGNPTMAFLWQAGRMRRLGTLHGFKRSVAEAINGAGQVAGAAMGTSEADYVEEATLYKHGRLYGLGRLGGNYSHAYGLNDHGQVVGSTDVGRQDDHGNQITHPFLWEQGRGMRDLGTLGGTYGDAHAINSHGVVVGNGTGPDDHEHAFLWERGRLYDLNRLIPLGTGWVLSDANAINDRGQIAGIGVFGGHEHAVLLTPQSLPGGG